MDMTWSSGTTNGMTGRVEHHGSVNEASDYMVATQRPRARHPNRKPSEIVLQDISRHYSHFLAFLKGKTAIHEFPCL
jgi:hypothetical protein